VLKLVRFMVEPSETQVEYQEIFGSGKKEDDMVE
jgi:hypothetical protein